MKCFAGQRNTGSEFEIYNLKSLKESMSKKERRSKMYKIIFITCLSIINIFSFIQCGSLLGRAGIMYTTTHNNFRDQQRAIGLVRMTNGFSVITPASGVGSTHGSCVFMDTCISVSGAIDLRETNTIFLQADLILDHGVTFSSGGNIYGYDRALILNGDLAIPDGKIIHTGGRIVIDGNGHKLILGNSSQLFVDTDATLTLRNLVLQNTRNQPGHPAVQCASSGSKLCLDNVELALADDFYFNRGQLFVHNDVAVTGTSAFVYRSTKPSYITADSTFYFNPETTFDFSPNTTGTPGLLAKDLLILQDATSQLYLDGCSLKTTMTGMRLTKGQIIFDNKISLTSAAQLQLKSAGNKISVNYGSVVDAVNWSPDGRYLAVGGQGPTSGNEIQIYQFNGTSFSLIASQNYGSVVDAVNWSPDGRYLAVGGQGPTSGNEIQIYQFNGTSLSLVSEQYYGNIIYSANWSPDGRYLAVGGQDPASGNEIQIYQFNGTSLSLVSEQNSGYRAWGLNWSPDGQYLATGIQNPTSGKEIQIYQFNGKSLSLVAEQAHGNLVYSASWSPDGRYLAICGENNTFSNEFQIYKFNGTSLSLIVGKEFESRLNSVKWGLDGRYLAVGLDYNASNIDFQIYIFNGTSLSLTYEQGGSGNLTICLDFSSDGKYIATCGVYEFIAYTLQYGPEVQTQALSNSIIFGNSTLGSSYDLNVRMLAGAQVNVDGLLNNDNVN